MRTTDTTGWFRALGAAACCAACLGVQASGGERPASRPAAAAAESDDFAPPAVPALKNKADMDLLELRDEQSFVYTEGGRDPMMFRTAPKKEDVPTAEDPIGQDRTGVEIVKPDTTSMTALDQERFMQSAWTTAESWFISGNHDAALKEIDRIDAVASRWSVPWPSPTARKMYERLLGLRETARRVSLKNAILKEFEVLPLTIEAVQQSDRGSAALINDRIMEVGERLTIGSGMTLVIDTIEADAVVFEFKGQKLRRRVGEQPAEAVKPATGRNVARPRAK